MILAKASPAQPCAEIRRVETAAAAEATGAFADRSSTVWSEPGRRVSCSRARFQCRAALALGEAFAARKMSPVERWQVPSRSQSNSAWVPCPRRRSEEHQTKNTRWQRRENFALDRTALNPGYSNLLRTHIISMDNLIPTHRVVKTMLIQEIFKSKPIITLSCQKWVKRGWVVALMGNPARQIGDRGGRSVARFDAIKPNFAFQRGGGRYKMAHANHCCLSPTGFAKLHLSSNGPRSFESRRLRFPLFPIERNSL